MFLSFSEHSFVEGSFFMGIIDDYIKKINELLQQQGDVELLDLILKLLQKSV